MSHPLLSIQDVSLSFAGVKALRSVSLEVNEGELVAIIGPNGAGKTSLFNCISGVYRPQSGNITLDGVVLTSRRPDDIASLGVARMFQNLALFDHLTVLENLLLGRHYRYESRWWHDLFWSSRTRAEEVRHRAFVEEIIDFLNLEVYRKTPVGILPTAYLSVWNSGGPCAWSPNSSSSMNPRRVSIRRRLKIWPATCWISRNSEESLKF